MREKYILHLIILALAVFHISTPFVYGQQYNNPKTTFLDPKEFKFSDQKFSVTLEPINEINFDTTEEGKLYFRIEIDGISFCTLRSENSLNEDQKKTLTMEKK